MARAKVHAVFGVQVYIYQKFNILLTNSNYVYGRLLLGFKRKTRVLKRAFVVFFFPSAAKRRRRSACVHMRSRD